MFCITSFQKQNDIPSWAEMEDYVFPIPHATYGVLPAINSSEGVKMMAVITKKGKIMFSDTIKSGKGVYVSGSYITT